MFVFLIIKDHIYFFTILYIILQIKQSTVFLMRKKSDSDEIVPRLLILDTFRKCNISSNVRCFNTDSFDSWHLSEFNSHDIWEIFLPWCVKVYENFQNMRH